jgi:hypothetical protein
MGKMIKKKKSDRNSFHFNYTLPEVIANSKYAQKNYYDYPLISSGFVKNTVDNFFANDMQGFHKDVLNLVENFDRQDKDSDYFAKNLVVKVDKIEEKKFKSSSIEDGKLKIELEDSIDSKETVSFELHNNRSGFEGTLTIFKKQVKIFEGNDYKGMGMRIDNITLRNAKKELILTLNYDYDMNAEPKIEHYKYVADINSFHHTLSVIEFKKEKKKK